MPIYPRDTKTKGRVYDVVVRDGSRTIWRRGFAQKGPAKTPGTALWEEMRLKNELREGRGIPSEKLTLGEFLTKTWLPSHEGGPVKTLGLYKSVVKRLTPLHATRLARLRHGDIQRWVNELLAEGLKASTVSSYLGVCAAALQMAVDHEDLARNPARKVNSPTPKPRRAPILGIKDVRELLNAASLTRHGPLIWLLVLTGKRWSELTRLRWADVDFDHNMLYIRDAKRPASERAVALAGDAVTELHLQRRRIAEMREKAGVFWEEEDLVFPDLRGGKLDQTYFWRFWKKFVGDRWPNLHEHDLRHQNATLMAWAGVHVRIAQERLGHATSKETLEVYTEVLAEDHVAAAEAVEALIRPRG